MGCSHQHARVKEEGSSAPVGLEAPGEGGDAAAGEVGAAAETPAEWIALSIMPQTLSVMGLLPVWHWREKCCKTAYSSRV